MKILTSLLGILLLATSAWAHDDPIPHRHEQGPPPRQDGPGINARMSRIIPGTLPRPFEQAGASIVAARLLDTNDERTVQALDQGAVSITAEGQLSGLFVASGLQHQQLVALEVILQYRGKRSQPDTSRSREMR